MPQKPNFDRNAYNREYRLKNRAVLKAKRKMYYEANRLQIAEKQKAYRQSVPKDVAKARRAKWNAAHKAREQKRYHVTRAWLPWLNAFRGSKQRAKRENIPFTLTKTWAQTRWTNRCEITDIEFVLSTSRHPYLFSPSIDRIIPSRGYTPENSRFVLHAVNALKGAGTDEQMLLISKAIVSYFDQKALPLRP